MTSGEYHRPELVGEWHQVVAGDARLDIFFRHINGPAAERGCQSLLVLFKNIRNRQGNKLDAEILRQSCRVTLAACRRKRSRHGNSGEESRHPVYYLAD